LGKRNRGEQNEGTETIKSIQNNRSLIHFFNHAPVVKNAKVLKLQIATQLRQQAPTAVGGGTNKNKDARRTLPWFLEEKKKDRKKQRGTTKEVGNTKRERGTRGRRCC